MRRLLILIALPAGVLAGWLAHRPVAAPVVASPARTCVAQEPVRADGDCDQVDLATRWCEARLSTLDTPARLAVVPVERPSGFDQAVRAALAACGVPADPVDVDCTEIPCVISARLEDDAAVEVAMATCPDLHALGFQRSPVQRWPVECPDGTVSTMGLIVAGSELDQIAEQLVPADVEADEFGPTFGKSWVMLGQIGRRADQLARRWPCE